MSNNTIDQAWDRVWRIGIVFWLATTAWIKYKVGFIPCSTNNPRCGILSSKWFHDLFGELVVELFIFTFTVGGVFIVSVFVDIFQGFSSPESDSSRPVRSPSGNAVHPTAGSSNQQAPASAIPHPIASISPTRKASVLIRQYSFLTSIILCAMIYVALLPCTPKTNCFVWPDVLWRFAPLGVFWWLFLMVTYGLSAIISHYVHKITGIAGSNAPAATATVQTKATSSLPQPNPSQMLAPTSPPPRPVPTAPRPAPPPPPETTLASLRSMHPSAFERWVANRFVNAGYTAHVTGGAGDDGIDIIVRHGNQIRYVVQCKRFGSNTVVTPEQVRDFRGAMTAHPEAAGYIVTTGSLSAQAATWVQKQPITIIDWRIIERWKPNPPA